MKGLRMQGEVIGEKMVTEGTPIQHLPALLFGLPEVHLSMQKDRRLRQKRKRDYK